MDGKEVPSQRSSSTRLYGKEGDHFRNRRGSARNKYHLKAISPYGSYLKETSSGAGKDVESRPGGKLS